MKRAGRWVGGGVVLLGSVGFLQVSQERSAPRLTETGTPFADLVSDQDSALVVVYDPGDCFKCDALMPLLQEWADGGDNRLAVALTRRPNKDERDQLALLWIWSEHIVARDAISKLVGAAFRPEILLFADGVEVASESYDPSLNPATRGKIVTYVLRTLDRERAPEGSVQP